MKGMDRAAKQALLPDFEIYSVDLTESKSVCSSSSYHDDDAETVHVGLDAVLILCFIFYST